MPAYSHKTGAREGPNERGRRGCVSRLLARSEATLRLTAAEPLARGTRSPAGRRRSSVVAAATKPITQSSITPITGRIAIRFAQQQAQRRSRVQTVSPCRARVGRRSGRADRTRSVRFAPVPAAAYRGSPSRSQAEKQPTNFWQELSIRIGVVRLTYRDPN